MRELFVDTNVFLRYLTNDVPEQAQAVERMLKLAEKGEIVLHTHILIVAEIVWTLESYYKLSREDVAEKVLAILNTEGLEVENAALLAQATPLYVSRNIDFIDAYSAVWMMARELSEAVTLDAKHFDRVAGIQALTPAQVR